MSAFSRRERYKQFIDKEKEYLGYYTLLFSYSDWDKLNPHEQQELERELQ